MKDEACTKKYFEDTLESIVLIVLRTESSEELGQLLETLLAPFATKLVAPDATSRSVETQLQLIGTIVKRCKSLSKRSPNPLYPLLKQLWPVFAGIFEKYFDKEDVIEALTRSLKHFMRSLMNDFDEFLHDYMNIIYSCYQVRLVSTTIQKYPLNSYLYASEVVVTVYGENEERLADLQLMFDKMCEHTFTLITSQEDFQVHPDIAADFFGMSMRYMRYCSKVIFGSSQIEGLIQFAIVGIGIEHREAAKALCLFFS